MSLKAFVNLVDRKTGKKRRDKNTLDAAAGCLRTKNVE
jgi:hypothetical protein